MAGVLSSAAFGAAGDIDPSFGMAGIVRHNVQQVANPGYDVLERPNAFALQSDGKMVVAGQSGSDASIVRFNADGTLDTTFGGGLGQVLIKFPGRTSEAHDVELQSDGRIVIGGRTSLPEGTSLRMTLARVTSSGTLDPTFDGDGMLEIEPSSGRGWAYEIAVDSVGRLVVVGELGGGVIARFNADGSFDTSFGVSGVVSVSASTLLLQSDDKIVVGTGGGSSISLSRFSADGSLEFSASMNYKDASWEGCDQIVQQADGKLVVLGYSFSGGTVPNEHIKLARFQLNGLPDPSFGGLYARLTFRWEKMKMQPWIENPQRLISWLDMNQFSAQLFINIGNCLTTITKWGGIEEDGSEDERERASHRASIKQMSQQLASMLEKICCHQSAKAAARFGEKLSSANISVEVANALSAELRAFIFEEMKTQVFFWTPPHRASWHGKTGREILGDECTGRFPNSDIANEAEQAAKCFAFGQYTACAFHLMRVCEAGVRALALAIGYDWAQSPNWGKFYKQYDAQLATNPTKHAEPWLSHAAFLEATGGNLRAVKDAWRNDTMHLDKTYDEDQAHHLLVVVPSFMRLIASRINEDGQFV